MSTIAQETILTVVGNLTANLELRCTNSGTAVADIHRTRRVLEVGESCAVALGTAEARIDASWQSHNPSAAMCSTRWACWRAQLRVRPDRAHVVIIGSLAPATCDHPEWTVGSRTWSPTLANQASHSAPLPRVQKPSR